MNEVTDEQLEMTSNAADDAIAEPSNDESVYASASKLGKLVIKFKLAVAWMWFCLKQTIAFIFTKPNAKESVVQFLIRQVMLSDSKGNPSWTITILVYTMLLVAYVSHYSTKLAFTTVNTLDPATGKVITQCVKGYPTEFWYLIIALSVVITTAFNAKSAATQSADSGVEPSGIISKVVSSVGAVISQLKSSK